MREGIKGLSDVFSSRQTNTSLSRPFMQQVCLRKVHSSGVKEEALRVTNWCYHFSLLIWQETLCHVNASLIPRPHYLHIHRTPTNAFGYPNPFQSLCQRLKRRSRFKYDHQSASPLVIPIDSYCSHIPSHHRGIPFPFGHLPLGAL